MPGTKQIIPLFPRRGDPCGRPPLIAEKLTELLIELFVFM